jgi:hypothetical protein
MAVEKTSGLDIGCGLTAPFETTPAAAAAETTCSDTDEDGLRESVHVITIPGAAQNWGTCVSRMDPASLPWCNSPLGE